MEILSRRKNLYTNLILALLVAVFMIFGVYQIIEKNNYKRSLLANYSRSLNATVKYVNDTEKTLTKARLSRMPKENAKLFAEAWKQSSLAQDNLSSMPITPQNAAELTEYLNQINEFSFEMMTKSMDGSELSIEEWRHTDDIREGCEKLAVLLNNTTAFDGPEQSFLKNASAKISLELFKSSATSTPSRQGIGEIEISVEEGVEISKHFLQDYNITDILYCGTTDREINKGIPVYSYEIYIDENKEPAIWMDVSRVGGYPVMMLSSVQTGEYGTSKPAEELIDLGDKFLEHAGFSDMEFVDYNLNGNSAVISYAQSLKGVIVYPELVKLKLNLIDGTIAGFQGTNYLTARRERSIDKPKLTQDEAIQFVSEQFKINGVGLAIVEPRDKQGEEAFCYRIEGSFDGGQYMIFINANNGRQEKIIRLSEEWVNYTDISSK